MRTEQKQYIWCVGLLCLAVIFTVCGQKPGQEQTKEEKSLKKTPERTLQEFDEEVQTLIQRGQEEITPPPPTPFDKIIQALEENQITKAQSVHLIFTAAFDSDNLLPDFEAPVPGMLPDSVVNEAYRWLHQNWASLSDEEKKSLEPFYVRPSDPKSFFHPDNQKDPEDSSESFSLIPQAYAAPTQEFKLEFTVWSNPRRVVKIYYYDHSPSGQQRALWAQESVQKAWPLFKQLLGLMPRDEVYLYLIPLHKVSGIAKIERYGPTDQVLVIHVNNSLDEPNTKATTSHELFHGFQYYLPIPPNRNNKVEGFLDRKQAEAWMMDATATWSEHYVWKDYNTEWRGLGSFFSNLNQHMVIYNGHREYATYPFYLFLTQNLGADIVKKHLYSVMGTDGRLVVSSTENFNHLFAKFALWNWNQDPERHYQDVPEFPSGMHVFPEMSPLNQAMYPNGPSFQSRVYRKDQEEHIKLTLSALSMTYQMHAIKDEVQKLVFQFDQKGDPRHKRQALIKIGDSWYWEDWTDTLERKFCRNHDAERVTAVVLMASSAEHKKDATYDLEYNVITKGSCAPEWRGTISWWWEYSTSRQFPALPGSIHYSGGSSMIAHETLVYDEQEGEFLIKNQFITYTYHESTSYNYDQEFGMQLDHKEQNYKGSTSSSWVIDEKHPYTSDAPTRLLRDDDDPLLFDVDVDEHEWGKPWIAVTNLRHSIRKAFPLEGIATPTPGTYDQTELDINQTDRFRTEPNDVKVTMSEDKKQIKAVIRQKSGNEIADWVITIEINYAYK